MVRVVLLRVILCLVLGTLGCGDSGQDGVTKGHTASEPAQVTSVGKPPATENAEPARASAESATSKAAEAQAGRPGQRRKGTVEPNQTEAPSTLSFWTSTFTTGDLKLALERGMNKAAFSALVERLGVDGKGTETKGMVFTRFGFTEQHPNSAIAWGEYENKSFMAGATATDAAKPEWEVVFVTNDIILALRMGMDYDEFDDALAEQSAFTGVKDADVGIQRVAFHLGRKESAVAVECSFGGKSFVVTSAGPAAAKLPITALITMLQSQEDDVRFKAARYLSRRGAESKAALPALMAAVKDSDSRVREAAVSALNKLGRDAKEAIGALTEALADSESRVRTTAAIALGHLGADAAGAAARLAELFQDTSRRIDERRYVADALGEIGPGAGAAVPTLMAVIDKKEEVRVEAALALWRIAKHAQALPALTEALKDPSQYVRRRAVSALGEIGPDAVAAVTVLLEASKHDSDDIVRKRSVEALKKIQPAAVEKVKTP